MRGVGHTQGLCAWSLRRETRRCARPRGVASFGGGSALVLPPPGPLAGARPVRPALRGLGALPRPLPRPLTGGGGGAAKVESGKTQLLILQINISINQQWEPEARPTAARKRNNTNIIQQVRENTNAIIDRLPTVRYKNNKTATSSPPVVWGKT